MIRSLYSFMVILCFGINCEAQLAKVPLLIQGDNIFVKIKYRSIDSLLFVFDTGASGTIMDSLTAIRAGLSTMNLKKAIAYGSGGAQSYSIASNQTLSLSDAVEINPVSLVLMNMEPLRKASGHRIDGIIGYDILKKYIASMNFIRKEITFYNNMQSVDTIDYVAIPVEFSKGINIPRFPLIIGVENGKTFTGKVMFDSGAATTLLISAPFSNFHHLNREICDSKIAYSRGLNAVNTAENVTISSMNIGNFKFGKMVVHLTKDDNALPKDGYMGLIGMNIINRFDVILNYVDRKIYLKPNINYGKFFKDSL